MNKGKSDQVIRISAISKINGSKRLQNVIMCVLCLLMRSEPVLRILFKDLDKTNCSHLMLQRILSYCSVDTIKRMFITGLFNDKSVLETVKIVLERRVDLNSPTLAQLIIDENVKYRKCSIIIFSISY